MRYAMLRVMNIERRTERRAGKSTYENLTTQATQAFYSWATGTFNCRTFQNPYQTSFKFSPGPLVHEHFKVYWTIRTLYVCLCLRTFEVYQTCSDISVNVSY